MLLKINSEIPPGWKGGFAQSNPAFAYPDPDLKSLPLSGNMDNINRIKRGLDVHWPEFSWLTEEGKEESRCFQRFAYDISNIGYDDRGRIWSIICPQQGFCIEKELCINVEVTVKGVKGWVNEPTRDLAADMQVEARIWFSPCSLNHGLVKTAFNAFSWTQNKQHFPWSKATAIQVSTNLPGDPDQPTFPVLRGLSPLFNAPDFTKHEDTSWTHAHIDVQIGDIIPTGHNIVDEFNKEVLNLFNHTTGNMLQPGGILSWNLWMYAPATVCTEDWKNHAHKWRESIDADHGPKSSKVQYADGTVFVPPDKKLLEKMEDIIKTAEKYLPHWPKIHF